MNIIIRLLLLHIFIALAAGALIFTWVGLNWLLDNHMLKLIGFICLVWLFSFIARTFDEKEEK